MRSVKGIFSDFLSNQVPKSISSVLWQLFNGVQAVMQHLEWKIDTYVREHNLLTASHRSSLRALAAENGFEPTLKIPAQGLLRIKINQSLYNSYGYPLYIPPYAEFKCKDSGLIYYYNGDKAIKLTGGQYDIPVVEGEIQQKKFKATGESIQRIYLSSDSIANGSITVRIGNDTYAEVKSFFDNDNFNDDKQFLVKWSHDIQNPIIIYLKGAKLNDSIEVTYRTTYGSFGNISGVVDFETSDIITGTSEEVSPSKTDIQIRNVYGFNLGSDGNDVNSLRAAIGFNHGSDLLFDNISYREFIHRFSTILLQKITVDEERRSFNYIYLSKKQCITSSLESIIDNYQRCIENNQYMLSAKEKEELSKIISEKEYCLTSHEIYDAEIQKYAFQIKYSTIDEKELHSEPLAKLIYTEFSKFLFENNYSFSFEQLIHEYQKENNIEVDYYIFSNLPIDEKSTIISNSDKMPILRGDFSINTTSGESVTLFCDINHVIDD